MKKTCMLVSALLVATQLSCAANYELIVKKTNPEPPTILQATQSTTIPRRLLFLSDKEARCPSQCTAVVKEQAEYQKFVSFVESLLMERGFELISGAIVSRIEDRLRDSKVREQWDRLEKALLLGKDTGADAIFEIKALYVTETKSVYLKETNSSAFILVPERYADEVRQRDPGSSAFPVLGWEATVELRLVDLNGKVIWSAAKTVRLSDRLPESWRVRLAPTYPFATPARSLGELPYNFDYNMYVYDTALQKSTLLEIIEELVGKIPVQSR
jgi:hypothetical protein